MYPCKYGILNMKRKGKFGRKIGSSECEKYDLCETEIL